MTFNLTLGHNSSAGLFNESGKCICAIEEERLSKVKSDSAFPKLAIEECLRQTWTDAIDITEVNLSHWFNGKADDSKYYQPKYIQRRFPNATIIDEVNHHLQHATSVWNFSGTKEGLTVIMDGFGNREEVISIYRDGNLISKVFGYNNSLGLMYQYATSAAGLKENEDEYKLLGYEVLSTLEPELIPMPVMEYTEPDPSELIDFNRLGKVKEYWHNKLAHMSVEDIAKTVQYNLEHKVLDIINSLHIDGELIQLGGGLFYNVKLNNAIMRKFGTICVNPVCGDQGNVFGTEGVYYDNLFLGLRELRNEVIPTTDEDIVESFTGNMEFGPRALGNTSTLAMPTMENVITINTYNHRNTVMPMAPIVTREFFKENFKNTDRVIKSEKYMIVSFDFKTMTDEWRGAAHYDPDRDTYTGRVQVIDEGDRLYEYIKQRGGIMINTSLNFHGTPILYNDDDYFLYINHFKTA